MAQIKPHHEERGTYVQAGKRAVRPAHGVDSAHDQAVKRVALQVSRKLCSQLDDRPARGQKKVTEKTECVEQRKCCHKLLAFVRRSRYQTEQDADVQIGNEGTVKEAQEFHGA